MKKQIPNPTEIRSDEDRIAETEDGCAEKVETSPDAPYNRTYERPAGDENDQAHDATEDEIEHTKAPYHGGAKCEAAIFARRASSAIAK